MKIFDVNSNELIKFSKKLDQIGNKMVPIAARQTLNSVAFETKKKHIPIEAEKAFTIRNKAFYKRFTRVETANGLDINKMYSKVGMFGNSQAVEDQKQQQLSGSIAGRSLIPLDSARVSGDHKKNVRVKNRIKNVNVVFDTSESKGGNHKKRFVQSAIKAVERFGSGAVIKHKTAKGKTFLYRIEIGGSDINTREYGLKVTPIYLVNPNKKVAIKDAKPFTLRAGMKGMKSANKYFEQNAKRLIDKLK